LHAGLLGPAVGFVGFDFEFRDGFHWVTGWQDFGIVGAKLVSCRCGASEIPVAFFVKAVGDGFDGVCQNAVVIADDEGEAGFDCT